VPGLGGSDSQQSNDADNQKPTDGSTALEAADIIDWIRLYMDSPHQCGGVLYR
jgi:hypothetical protein